MFTLKACRVNKNITQKEAAQRVGISARTLQNYEDGITFPPVDIAKRLLGLYDVGWNDVDFLIKEV